MSPRAIPTSPPLKCTEKQWQKTVTDTAAVYRWTLQYHTWVSINSAGGFPDLVLVRDERIVIAELKSEHGRARVPQEVAAARPEWLAHRDLSDDQARWLGALHAISVSLADSIDPDKHAAAGHPTVEVYVWRPSDWPLVQRVLR